MVITSNLIKSNFKKLETLSSIMDEIIKIKNNDSNERSFNTKNLEIYEKTFFVCISPNLDNFKLISDTLSISANIQKTNNSRSKSSNPKFIKI